MSQTPEEIEADIVRQREQLAESVAALQDKLDVKAHAHDKVTELKERSTTAAGRPRPALLAAVGGLVGVVVLVWWRRRSAG